MWSYNNGHRQAISLIYFSPWLNRCLRVIHYLLHGYWVILGPEGGPSDLVQIKLGTRRDGNNSLLLRSRLRCSATQGICAQDLPSVERRVCTRQENERRRNLAGLPGPAESRPLSSPSMPSVGRLAGWGGVCTGRGATVLTWTPLGMSCWARVFVRLKMGSLGRAVVHH